MIEQQPIDLDGALVERILPPDKNSPGLGYLRKIYPTISVPLENLSLQVSKDIDVTRPLFWLTYLENCGLLVKDIRNSLEEVKEEYNIDFSLHESAVQDWLKKAISVMDKSENLNFDDTRLAILKELVFEIKPSLIREYETPLLEMLGDIEELLELESPNSFE
ncbi:MAG TPA: hypothetical protein VIK81_02395 [Patescibacteria group bacterium]